jgi:hypothetical protein
MRHAAGEVHVFRIAAILLWASLILNPIQQAVAGTTGGMSDDELILEIGLEKNRVYVGEALSVTITLLAGQLPVRNIQYPVLKGGGYRISAFESPLIRSETRNGRDYAVYKFAATLTALKRGELQVGPAELAFDVLEPSGGAAAYFGGSEPRTVTIRTKSVSLAILPLPTAGRPSGFNGAIGRFKVSRQAWPSKIRIGDPVTVTTRIEGSDNMNGFSCLSVQLPGVRSYPPRTRRTAKLLSCEQVLVPEISTGLTIPGATIHYFDPIAGRYHTQDSEPVRIDVTGDNGTVVGVAKASTHTPAKIPAPRMFGIGVFQAGFGLLAGLLTLVLLFHALMRRKVSIKKHLDPPPADKSIISNWLAEARGALAAHDPERFHTSIFRALQQHLGSKYGLAVFAITGEIVNEVLRPIGLQEHVLDIYEKLFLICDQARFSPDSEWENAMPETYRLLEQVMEEN